MALKKPRIKFPKSAAKGEVFEVKVILKHPMETGRRKDKKTGEPIPQRIIEKFECVYNGQPVFVGHLQAGISANPYFSFYVKATDSGEVKFKWTEDTGESVEEVRKLTVT